MPRWIAAFLLIGTYAWSEPQAIRMEWSRGWTKHYITNDFKAYKQAPKGVDPLEGDGIVYFDFKLAPDKVLLVAAQPRNKPPRAWIDLDFDGQLTDQKPIELKEYGARVKTSFEIGWRDSKDAAPYRIPATLMFGTEEKKGQVWLRLLAHRQAKAVIGGRLRWIVAFSGNSDLRFDDEEEDRIYVDVDGDGKLTTGESSHERVIPGTPFRAGKLGYVIQLADPTATTLRVTPSAPAPPPRPRAWPKPRRRARTYSRTFRTSRTLGQLISQYDRLRKRGWSVGVFGASRYLDFIGVVGTADSVKFLLRVAKKEKDAELSAAAAKALGNATNAPHAKLVMRAARTTKDSRRAVALLRALDATDARDRHTYFLDLLESTRDDAVREVCADVVAGAGSRFRLMLQDRVGSFRQPAANYFAYRSATRFGTDPPAKELLATALEGKDARLRLLALADIAWIGMRDTRSQIVAIATGEVGRKRVNAELARVIIDSLGPIAGAEEIPLLFKCVPVASRETRTHLVDLLRRVRNDPAEAAIRSQLAHKDPAVRGVAVQVLAMLPDPKNGEALAAQLAWERDPGVRLPLVTALGQGGVLGAAPGLLGILRTEKKNAELREATLIAIARLGFESKKIAAYFDKQAKSHAWVVRLDATDAVARYSGASAVPYLGERLSDDEWRIRVAAAQGLGRIRVKEVIGPLIASLETEQDKRARRAVADALFRTTGQHLYDIHKLWVKWWVRSHSGFVVPATVPSRNESKGDRKTVANFYGIPVESERAVFVIDQSGSMGGWGDGENNLDRAIKETLKVIGKMRDGSKVNVILFESGIHPWFRKLVKLGKKSRARLKTHLEKQRPTGGTNLYDGLEMALKMRDVDTVYLLSDGAPGSGKFIDEEDILREIGKLNKRLRIQIHCISLGRDSTLLRRLSEQSGGTYAQR